MRCFRKAFCVSYDSHTNFRLSLFILEDNEVDRLLGGGKRDARLLSWSAVPYRISPLTSYSSPRPEPLRMLDSEYSPTRADE